MDYPKPIRVISDIHLAHPACRLDSIEQLRPVFEGAGTIIFNGDTVELRSEELRNEGKSHFAAINEMLDEMGIERVFLRGNHDPGLCEREYVDLEKEQALVIHGDCLFENISPWNTKIWTLESTFAGIRSRYDADKLTSCFETRMVCHQECRLAAYGDEEKPYKPRFKKLRAVIRLVFPIKRPIEILKCWAGLGKRISGFQAQFWPQKRWILVGHTHRPAVWKLKNGLVGINTGGFLSVGSAWVVDIGEATVCVRKVDENGETIRLGRTIFERSIC